MTIGPDDIQWLTTAPNPRSPATGYDAGQRGWKLHAVATKSDKFSEINGVRALCGMLPAHGWSLDMFIEDKCQKCQAHWWLKPRGLPNDETLARGSVCVNRISMFALRKPPAACPRHTAGALTCSSLTNVRVACKK